MWQKDNSGYTENISNQSLIGKVSEINNNGIQEIVIDDETYSINTILINNDLVLDGEKQVIGATLENKVYEFGDNTQDVATVDQQGNTQYAKNMVVLKVNGNLTINSNVKITTCKSEEGYGGPKGFMIYCTGTLTNNGIIDMTARGAISEGQNVYLWQNSDGSYEYVPKIGAAGGPSITSGYDRAGAAGYNGTERGTGGGGSGRGNRLSFEWKKPGAGAAGTSYSGGTGGGAANSECTGQNGGPNGSYGGYGSGKNMDGGVGNPGGTGRYKGANGTGGLLIIFANDLKQYGEINSKGTGHNANGGCSGGGSVNIFYRICDKLGTESAVGGKSTNSGRCRWRWKYINRKYFNRKLYYKWHR